MLSNRKQQKTEEDQDVEYSLENPASYVEHPIDRPAGGRASCTRNYTWPAEVAHKSVSLWRRRMLGFGVVVVGVGGGKTMLRVNDKD